jgi:hypothetical protein
MPLAIIMCTEHQIADGGSIDALMKAACFCFFSHVKRHKHCSLLKDVL